MKQNKLTSDVLLQNPLAGSVSSACKRKTYVNPTVEHQQVELEHGFLAGSKETKSTESPKGLYEDVTIGAEFDWDNN